MMKRGSLRWRGAHRLSVSCPAIMSLIVLVTPAALLAQTPGVVSTAPAPNELNVSTSSNVSVTFDTDMNPATITASTFLVNGMATGPHGGIISYEPGTRTATLDPAADFGAGEIVTVVLTGGIVAAGGQALAGYAWAFTTASAPAPAIFPTLSQTPPAFGLRSLCAVDIDADGDLDLATGDGVSGSAMGAPVYVFTNLGDGVFAEAVRYWVGSQAWPVVASDLDGDGDVDLATGSYNDMALSVLLNQGDGTFADDLTYPIRYGATSIACADVDADGDRDLAVGYFFSSFVSVLVNDGDGTFSPATDYEAGAEGTWSVASADLDRDGDLDLAVTDVASDLVSVLMNNGDGTFADRITYPTGGGPAWVFAGDLDADGNLDLAIANWNSDDVSVLRNQGSGTFVGSGSYAVGNDPRGVCAADLDGDGDLDLAASNYGATYVSLLANQGDGTYGEAVALWTGPDAPTSLVAADLDGDADLDLGVSMRNGTGIVLLVNDEPVATPSATPASAGFDIVSMSPTPSEPPLIIGFALSEVMPVTAEIVSVAGERVRLLAHRRSFGTGVHHLTWDGRSDRGAPAASGVYYVRLTTALGVRSARTILVK